MFSNIDDTTQTMDAIVNYIMTGQGEFGGVQDWQEFLKAVRLKCNATGKEAKDREIPVASWRKFYRIANKAINDKTAIFARSIAENGRETRLGDSLKYIRKNQVHVIDIAKLSEDKQAYVFGDALRTIYNLQLGEYSGAEDVDPPSRIVVFIDENKFAGFDLSKYDCEIQNVLRFYLINRDMARDMEV